MSALKFITRFLMFLFLAIGTNQSWAVERPLKPYESVIIWGFAFGMWVLGDAASTESR